MDLPYAESVHRKALKEEALRRGEEEQARFEEARKQRQAQERARSTRGGKRQGPAPSTPNRPHASTPARSAKTAPRNDAHSAADANAKTAGKSHRAAPVERHPASAATATQPPKSPELKADSTRLFLESPAMDLFEKGADVQASVCPQCQHELRKIVHVERTVRVCLQCRGLFLPFSVWPSFSKDSEWFHQLGPAIRLHAGREPGTGAGP